MSRMRLRAGLLAGAASLALHSPPASAACEGRSACVDAILDAARDGRDADEYAAMNALRGHPRRNAPDGTGVRVPPRTTLDEGDVATLPDARRAAAVAALDPARLDAAALGLQAALTRVPYHAPYWSDLAIVFARQGRHERAVAALLVADAWAVDQAASRRAWQDAAGQAAVTSMRADYAAALARIAELDAEHARTDGVVPPGRYGDPAWTPARIDFKTCAYPEYPIDALRDEETGDVALSFLVGMDGSVQRARLFTSSGHALLDNEAMLSLADCRFKPAARNGKPVAVWQRVEYRWRLE